jgi:hypothetical protein
MKKLLLAGVAALFLATGTAHAQELDIHSGENLVMLLLEKVDGENTWSPSILKKTASLF